MMLPRRPLSDRMLQATTCDCSRERAEAPRPSVLVIDDDALVLRAFRRALEGLDVDLVITSDPLEGLRLALDGEFEVVVSDYAMPDIDGLDLLGQLGRAGSSSTRILLSGHGEGLSNAVLQRASIDALMHKPWQREELRAAVLQAAESSRGRRPSQP